MKFVGCIKELNTAEEILNHLCTCDYHFGLGLGKNRQLRANDKNEYYLATYGGDDSNNKNITKREALELINSAIA